MDASGRFERYIGHLAEGLGIGASGSSREAERPPQGLMPPLSRKSVEPMAARVDPLQASAKYQALHNFVAKEDPRTEVVANRVLRKSIDAVLKTLNPRSGHDPARQGLQGRVRLDPLHDGTAFRGEALTGAQADLRKHRRHRRLAHRMLDALDEIIARKVVGQVPHHIAHDGHRKLRVDLHGFIGNRYALVVHPELAAQQTRLVLGRRVRGIDEADIRARLEGRALAALQVEREVDRR
ncbi:MAG: transposase [Burkholderiaceae bacterium]